MVDGLSVKDVYDNIGSALIEVNTNLDIEKFDFDNLKENIHNESANIKQSLDVIESSLVEFKQNLTEFFDSVEQPYYEASKEIYANEAGNDAEYMLDRYAYKQLIYEQETRDFFLNRVKLYTNWKWPALEIRPAQGDFTDALIGCDPLYLADTTPQMLKLVKDKWTGEFQRRVRYYTINETAEMPLNTLPQNAIGVIVSVDFFNFRSVDVIERYIKSMFQTLRPGGTAVFTYNNCDHPIGVDNFEHGYYCYTPGRKIKQICEKYGFRVMASFDMDNNVSWLEIQKPGRLSSLRGGQNLAKIETLK